MFLSVRRSVRDCSIQSEVQRDIGPITPHVGLSATPKCSNVGLSAALLRLPAGPANSSIPSSSCHVSILESWTVRPVVMYV